MFHPMSHLLQRRFGLAAPPTRDLVIERGLPVRMPDGVDLMADRWAPRNAAEGLPVALVRTPYGRAIMGAMIARPLAERGFQVITQSVRGTHDSGGVMDPLRQERADGLATLDWVRAQPWFGGSIVLTGLSYLGYVQWAMADALPPEVKAMITVVTESALTLEFLRPGGLSLETPFGWGVMIATQERRGAIFRQRSQAHRTAAALSRLPLKDADIAATGVRSDYIQDILAHDATSVRWAGFDHRDAVANVPVPVSSIAGWYDIFLPGQLRDFRALQAAGRPARLTVGPWTHAANEVFMQLIRETLDFGLPLARGEQLPERAPVRLFDTGTQAWRDETTWPPEGYAPQRFHLRADRTLAVESPSDGAPDRYRYDPADPTPAAGGVRLTDDCGPVDNRALEARPDVLSYTTAALDTAVEVIGDVHAEIWFRSSLPYADVFVRLCDVHPDGRSINICDGLVSITGADELACRTVTLWPTTHVFSAGHRIRVQVSSGAFPRYARNHGTGEPHPTAVGLRAADQEVHHDPAHPSAVILPTRQA